MAHNLSFRLNERGDFVERRNIQSGPAWHGFGRIEERVGISEAIQWGGLGYTVAKLPNVHKIADLEIPSTKSFFTYRTDTNVVLGPHVGSIYTCLQNIDALNIVDSFGQYQIETAGVLKDGAIAFVCMKSDQRVVVGKNDVTEMYLLFVNSFDGSIPISVIFTPIRVVCNNTLSAALKGTKDRYTFRHTINAENKIRETAKILGLLEKSTENMQRVFNVLAETRVDPIDFLGHIYLTKEEITAFELGETFSDSAHFEDVLSTRKKNIILDVLEYSETGPGQKEWSGTVWGMYNAITGTLSHKNFDDPEDQMLSTVFNLNYQNLSAKAITLGSDPFMITKIKGLERALFN